jgi:hypothetical protein
VVDWSWELLDEPERVLAARLSVFAGSAALESIEAVCGVDILDPITALVDKSLVEVAGGRYRMLETIRAYAAARLAERGETDALRRAHAAHFLALAEEADPRLRTAGQLEWAERLRVEHDNLAAALRYLIDTRDAAGGLRMCAALCGYWWPYGFRSEGAGWAVQVVAMVPDGPPEGLRRAYAMCWLTAQTGEVVELMAQPDRLRDLLTTLCAMLDEAVAEGTPHPLLSLVWVFVTLLTGRPHEAFTRLNGYLRGDDPWLRCAASLARGMMRFGSGRIRPAAADLERAAAGFRELGERGGLGQALIALADVANADRDPARALALIEEASVLLRPSLGGEDSHMLFARLAGIRAQSGDLQGARDELVRARSALPADPSASVASHVVLAEADLARRSGDPRTAIALYESLRADLADTPTEPSRQQRAMVNGQLARLMAEGGDRQRARDLLGEGLRILGDSADLGLFVLLVEGFALIEDDPTRVATMAGALQALRGGWVPFAPSAEAIKALDLARTQLGEDRYGVAHAAGRVMGRGGLTAYLS